MKVIVQNGDIKGAIRKFLRGNASIRSDCDRHEYAMTRSQRRRQKDHAAAQRHKRRAKKLLDLG